MWRCIILCRSFIPRSSLAASGAVGITFASVSRSRCFHAARVERVTAPPLHPSGGVLASSVDDELLAESLSGSMEPLAVPPPASLLQQLLLRQRTLHPQHTSKGDRSDETTRVRLRRRNSSLHASVVSTPPVSLTALTAAILSSGVVPTTQHFNHLLQLAVAAEQWEQVDRIQLTHSGLLMAVEEKMNEQKKGDESPVRDGGSSVCYSMLPALRSLESLLTPSATTFDLLMEAELRKGAAEATTAGKLGGAWAVLDLLEDREAHGIPFTEAGLHHALEAYSILSQLNKSSPEHSTSTLAELREVYYRQGRRLREPSKHQESRSPTGAPSSAEVLPVAAASVVHQQWNTQQPIWMVAHQLYESFYGSYRAIPPAHSSPSAPGGHKSLHLSVFVLMLRLLRDAGKPQLVVQEFQFCEERLRRWYCGGGGVVESRMSWELWVIAMRSARDCGDWKVAAKIWADAARASSLVLPLREEGAVPAPLSQHGVTWSDPLASAGAASVSGVHQYLPVILQLLLHTLRRVGRYDDVLTCLRTLAPHMQQYGGYPSPSWLWTDESIVFVAQAAMAMKEHELLLRLCCGTTSSDKREDLPMDVFDIALRSVQVARVCRQSPPENCSWDVWAARILRRAIQQVWRGGSRPAVPVAYGTLLQQLKGVCQERQPILSRESPVPATSAEVRDDHASLLLRCQAAVAHFRSLRRPDALAVSLLSCLAECASCPARNTDPQQQEDVKAFLASELPLIFTALLESVSSLSSKVPPALHLTAVTSPAVVATCRALMMAGDLFAATRLIEAAKQGQWVDAYSVESVLSDIQSSAEEMVAQMYLHHLHHAMQLSVTPFAAVPLSSASQNATPHIITLMMMKVPERGAALDSAAQLLVQAALDLIRSEHEPASDSFTAVCAALQSSTREIALQPLRQAVLHAVLEKCCVSSPRVCKDMVLRLLLSCVSTPMPLLEPLARHPLPCSAEAVTFRVLRRLLRWWDSSADVCVAAVRGILLDWLRVSTWADSDAWETASEESRGAVEFALEAWVWCGRHRQRQLLRESQAGLLAVLDGVGKRRKLVSTEAVGRTVLVACQTLSSGPHEEVMEESWPLLSTLLKRLVAGSHHHPQGSPVVAPVSTEQRRIRLDSTVAILEKIQKTLHSLLVKHSLDTHRHRCRATPQTHPRHRPDTLSQPSTTAQLRGAAREYLEISNALVTEVETHPVGEAPSTSLLERLTDAMWDVHYSLFVWEYVFAQLPDVTAIHCSEHLCQLLWVRHAHRLPLTHIMEKWCVIVSTQSISSSQLFAFGRFSSSSSVMMLQLVKAVHELTLQVEKLGQTLAGPSPAATSPSQHRSSLPPLPVIGQRALDCFTSPWVVLAWSMVHSAATATSFFSSSPPPLISLQEAAIRAVVLSMIEAEESVASAGVGALSESSLHRMLGWQCSSVSLYTQLVMSLPGFNGDEDAQRALVRTAMRERRKWWSSLQPMLDASQSCLTPTAVSPLFLWSLFVGGEGVGASGVILCEEELVRELLLTVSCEATPLSLCEWRAAGQLDMLWRLLAAFPRVAGEELRGYTGGSLSPRQLHGLTCLFMEVLRYPTRTAAPPSLVRAAIAWLLKTYGTLIPLTPTPSAAEVKEQDDRHYTALMTSYPDEAVFDTAAKTSSAAPGDAVWLGERDVSSPITEAATQVAYSPRCVLRREEEEALEAQLLSDGLTARTAKELLSDSARVCYPPSVVNALQKVAGADKTPLLHLVNDFSIAAERWVQSLRATLTVGETPFTFGKIHVWGVLESVLHGVFHMNPPGSLTYSIARDRNSSSQKEMGHVERSVCEGDAALFRELCQVVSSVALKAAGDTAVKPKAKETLGCGGVTALLTPEGVGAVLDAAVQSVRRMVEAQALTDAESWGRVGSLLLLLEMACSLPGALPFGSITSSFLTQNLTPYLRHLGSTQSTDAVVSQLFTQLLFPMGFMEWESVKADEAASVLRHFALMASPCWIVTQQPSSGIKGLSSSEDVLCSAWRLLTRRQFSIASSERFLHHISPSWLQSGVLLGMWREMMNTMQHAASEPSAHIITSQALYNVAVAVFSVASISAHVCDCSDLSHEMVKKGLVAVLTEVQLERLQRVARSLSLSSHRAITAYLRRSKQASAQRGKGSRLDRGRNSYLCRLWVAQPLKAVAQWHPAVDDDLKLLIPALDVERYQEEPGMGQALATVLGEDDRHQKKVLEALTCVMESDEAAWLQWRQGQSHRSTRHRRVKSSPREDAEESSPSPLSLAWDLLREAPPALLPRRQLLAFFQNPPPHLPHTIHFIPASWSALVIEACPTWMDAIAVLKSSLGTLSRSSCVACAVQHHMMQHLLRRLREDAAFRDGIHRFSLPTASSAPGVLLQHSSKAQVPTGMAAIVLYMYAHCSPPAALPQRLVTEMIRCSTGDPTLCADLFVSVFLRQSYARLEGVHVWLSLLRAAKRLLQSKGEEERLQCDALIVMVMDHYLLILCGRPLLVQEAVRQPYQILEDGLASYLQARYGGVSKWLPTVSGRNTLWKAFAGVYRFRIRRDDNGIMNDIIAVLKARHVMSDVEELLIDSETGMNERMH